MELRPTIESARLVLRPFTLADAPAVQRLAGDREVAGNTLNIEHPYEDGMAEEWIDSLQAEHEAGTIVNFAIVLRSDDSFIGAIGLLLNRAHQHAELGYWIGKPYWNHGYATEAARAVVKFGFDTVGLHRIFAGHYARNPASGQVLQKIGMTYEGRLRQHIQKWGQFEDEERYGILRSEFLAQ